MHLNYLRDRRTLKPLDLDTLTVGQPVYAPSDDDKGGYRPAVITEVSNGVITYEFTERNLSRVWERASGPRTITNDGV